MAQMRGEGGGGQNWQNQAVQAANKVETMVLNLGADSLVFFFPFTHQLLHAWVGKN